MNIYLYLIGIGIDDMFIFMFGIVEVLFLMIVLIEDRIIFMMKKSGVVIIIILLIDLFVFIVGVMFVFVSIRLFCIYIGI